MNPNKDHLMKTILVTVFIPGILQAVATVSLSVLLMSSGEEGLMEVAGVIMAMLAFVGIGAGLNFYLWCKRKHEFAGVQLFVSTLKVPVILCVIQILGMFDIPLFQQIQDFAKMVMDFLFF